MRITSETTEQQGSDYVHAIVNGIIASKGPDRMIGDSVAITIAAWWQSPGWSGKAFAELASTGSADHEELLANLHNAVKEADNDADRNCLIALFAWIMRKVYDL